jgi:hypothetical protein
MNHDDIILMAGHRDVPPWVMKLVQDCVEVERQRCERICYDMIERSGYSGAEHAGFENGCIACAEAVADEMHQLLRRHEGS